MTDRKDKRILIVNVNWLGDVLFSTPLIRAIREAYPAAYLACIVHPRCKELLETNPRLDEIIVYDERGEHKSLIDKLKLISLLRKKRFDTVFILHRSFTKALIMSLSGIRVRVGYPTKNRSALLTIIAEEPKGEIHKVDYFLNLAKALGIKPKGHSYEFYVKESDREFVRDFLGKNGVSEDDAIVVLCPGGNWDPKRWPKENFARLGDMLAEKFNAKIILSGSRKDLGLVEDISSHMKNKPVISCGKTNLRQLGALFGRADLVIANDTGPMHLAVAMKANTIALFGPTSPKITGPYGEGNYKVIFKNDFCEVPCYNFKCKVYKCMNAIKVEDVFSEVKKILEK